MHEIPAPQRQVSRSIERSSERSIESIREAAPPPAAASRRVATPEERTAVLTDPAMRRVVETLDARGVAPRVRNKPPADPAKENGAKGLNRRAAPRETP